MDFVRMVFPKEAAHRTVSLFGHLSKVQFIDLNEDKPANQREYNFQLQRCAETERILRVFRDLSEQYKLSPPVPSAAVQFQSQFGQAGSAPSTVEELEPTVKRQEQYLNQLCSNIEELQQNRWRCYENIKALELSAVHFGQQQQTTGLGGGDMSSGLLGTGVEMSGMDSASGSLTNVVGVIAKEKIPTFEKILFRATRGNIVVRFTPILDVQGNPEPIWDAQEGREVEKQVFVGFLQGAHTYDKVKRICDVVGAHVYNYDEGGVRSDLEQLRVSLKEHDEIVNQSESEIRSTLGEINASFCAWEDLAKQETGIYATLNRFKYTGGGESGEYVVAEGWIPTSSMAEIRQTLETACRDSNVGQLGATMEKSEAPHGNSVPPTYYVVNKYTTAFQAIVEAYGVARYREHNPTVYTIITFPFLFAVMFGDAGHGLLMLALAVYFIINEKQLGSGPINEMVQTAFDGRYVVFLMAVFAIYCGLLYNEVFGMPLNLYGGSRWHYPEKSTMAGGWKECYKLKSEPAPGSLPVFDDPQMLAGCNVPPMEPYPIGMDPVWKFSSGGLIYFNSLKMKMSVVFGVIQMVFGIILKATNDIKHKRPLDLWCEFVPQMIFMNGIFGYMIILIFIKWSTCWVPASHYLPGGELVFNTKPLPEGNFYYNGQDGAELVSDPKPRCAPVEDVNVKVQGDSWIGYSHPPDIKQILINMVMDFGNPHPDDFNLFAGMNAFHTVLVPIAVLMIPIMLLPKPLILKQRAAAGTLEHDPADPHAGEEFEFGEVPIALS